MIFDGYTAYKTGTCMILIDKDKIVLVNLLNIEYVQEFCTHGKILKTKDGKEYVVFEKDTQIERTKLPKGFKWNKEIYKTEKWYDARSGWSGEDNFYKFTLLFDKKTAVLSNPEFLLNKLQKACEKAEW